MTNYFVGKGGSDVADGTTWANRKLTLGAAELLSLVAGDNVWVGPGIYREQLQLADERSGSAGKPITYIGDVSGKMTDGIGGIVAITGSNDDDVRTRAYCIYHLANRTVHYRIFRGFYMYLTTDQNILFASQSGDSYSNIIIEDCVIPGPERVLDGGAIEFQSIDSAAYSGIIIRRCLIGGIVFSGSAYDIGARIENCLFALAHDLQDQYYVDITNVYGITITNSTFFQSRESDYYVVRVTGSSGNNVYIYNCLFRSCRITANTTGVIVDDYNCYQKQNPSSGAYLNNVTAGGNTVFYALLFMPPLLASNIMYPDSFYTFAPYSQVPGLACNSEAAPDDFYGIPRPALYTKKTRGAIQHNVATRETTTVYGLSTESLKLPDAMSIQIMIPITGKSMTVQARVYREANYVGTPPQIVIRQDGEADIVGTDSGAVSTWNLLKVAFRPASLPKYIAVEYKSDNEAISGNYATFFDALKAK